MTATNGVYIDHIWVQELNGGSIAMGEVNISGNEFYGGYYGIYFFGDFFYLTNTTVDVGDVVMNNNTFENQTADAMHIDYYDADYWYGTTNGTYGDLVINGNTITSVTTDAIYVYDYAYFEYFYNDTSLTVGDLYIEGNEINVSGDGIYVYYQGAFYMYDNASIAMGEVFINSNTIVSRNESGIDLEYLEFGKGMYNNSEVTTGAVHIDENRINAHSCAIEVYYDYVATYMDENGTLRMGDIYVQENEISGDSDGIYLAYYDGVVGYDMYGNASAELPDYVITGNTFNVTGNGIYLYTCENPYEIYDDTIFDFGGAFIDDNTFNGEDFGMDNGIYFQYDDFCSDNNNDSTTLVGEVTITNNRFYDLGSGAVYIYYDDIPSDGIMHDNASLEVGGLAIADNVIDGASYGIEVDYYIIYSNSNSTVSFGDLNITGNEISNVTEDGIYVYYDLDADDNSTQTIGRVLIQDNILDGASAVGVYMWLNGLYEGGTSVVNLGDPIIDSNIIENWVTGIYLQNIENATIKRNMIVNNTGVPPSGVHLNPDSAYNQIYENCFIGNKPYQAVDDGTNNIFDRNFWDDWNGSGPYEIAGTANNTDNNPRDECPVGQELPAPAQVPALTPAGILALVGILSGIVVLNIVRRRTSEE